MSRVYAWVLAAFVLLLVLQVFLLHSWSHSGSNEHQGSSLRVKANEQKQGLPARAERLQMAYTESALTQNQRDALTGQAGAEIQEANMQLFSEAACVGSPIDAAGIIAAVVVLTYNRLEYLQQCITSVLAMHSADETNRLRFPLYISQDGNQSDIAQLARSYAPSVYHMQHLEADSFPERKQSEPIAYYRIASHYKFMMRQMFDCLKYPKLIILEDDMRLAIDFFPYFATGAKLLDSDSSLYCVSSWNDHGQAQFVQNSSRLERSDFFPGLGWMLTNALWQSLKSRWPTAYWDDWMRLRAVRNGRQCIRPEICRTYNFGEKGSSHGQYYAKYLKPIKLNDVLVDWQKQDLQYLQSKTYAQGTGHKLASAKRLTSTDEIKLATGTVKLMYDGREGYEKLAHKLGIIDDWKDGDPRASYNGIVTLHMHNVEVLLVPVPVVEKALKHRRAGKPDKILEKRLEAAVAHEKKVKEVLAQRTRRQA